MIPGFCLLYRYWPKSQKQVDREKGSDALPVRLNQARTSPNQKVEQFKPTMMVKKYTT